MQIAELDGKNFEQFIQQEEVTVVDFWAPWCNPCKVMLPVVEKLSLALKGKATFGKVDIDEEGALAGRLSISSIPRFRIYRKGMMLQEVEGALPPKKLQDIIEGYCEQGETVGA
jgi:thioredoxin 1